MHTTAKLRCLPANIYLEYPRYYFIFASSSVTHNRRAARLSSTGTTTWIIPHISHGSPALGALHAKKKKHVLCNMLDAVQHGDDPRSLPFPLRSKDVRSWRHVTFNTWQAHTHTYAWCVSIGQKHALWSRVARVDYMLLMGGPIVNR